MNRDHKTHDDQGSQTANQSRLFRLKQPQVWILISLFVLLALFLILFKVDYQVSKWEVNARDWTGFGQSYDENALEVTEKGTETTGTSKKETTKTTITTKRLQSAKTLWDWMTLLLAPATLAGLGFLFQSSQEKAKRDKEEADKARDADQQREQALQTYFDQLAELLVDKQLKKLLPAKHATVVMNMPNEEGTDASIATAAVTTKPEMSINTAAALDVVRARTLALLRMFDQDIPRKASVLSFLADTDLLNHLDLDLSSIRLEGANLKKVNFSTCKLQSANLHNAYLGDANFFDANLTGADFRGANLRGVNLRGANLWTANLSGADLFDAKLSGVDLVDANLTNANLVVASIIGADLNGADLNGADLSGAYLWNANLTGDDLDQAKKAAVTCIQSAKNWRQAQYSSGIRELLGLPQDPAKTQDTAI